MSADKTWFLLPTVSLWKRDVVRFFRQRNRIISALATPLVFWILLGAGFSASFQPPGSPDDASYLAYFFPGTIVLIILFTAIFSTISVIEDRREGFLQGVLVAPVAPGAIVMGKLLGGMTIAFIQAAIFTILAPFAGFALGPVNLALLFVAYIAVGLSLTGLGLVVAWPMDSTQGFHAIMNVFLLPLWILSGAMFPMSGGSAWVHWAGLINPVTYGVTAVRSAFSWKPGDDLTPFVVGIGVTLLFGFALFAICMKLVATTKRE